MSFDEVVFEAIAYYRYIGATIREVDQICRIHGESVDLKKQRQAALVSLTEAGRVIQLGKRWYLTKAAFATTKGRVRQPAFESADILILLALLFAERPLALRDIIARVDFIDRVIVTFDEVYGGLNRLCSARLAIAKKSESFTVGPRALAFLPTLKKAKRSLGSQLETLKNLVACPCCGVRLERVAWKVEISESAYNQAVRDHLDGH